MTTQHEGQDESQSRLFAQVGLMLSGIPGVVDGLEGAVAHPADWAEPGGADYHHRERTLLVRDADVDRVTSVVSGTRVAHDNNIRGLTRLQFSPDERRTVEEACADIDRVHGEGVATPDHILYITTVTHCPATEPEEIPADAPPDPGVSAEPDDGEGTLVAILDGGLLPGAATEHAWLEGVTGENENPIGGYPPRILPYAGHGTFMAGVARTMAPKADVWVGRTVPQARCHLRVRPGQAGVRRTQEGRGGHLASFGTNSRNDVPLLGFEIVEERLRSHAGTVLVAAAGNDRRGARSGRPLILGRSAWAPSTLTRRARRGSPTTGPGWMSSRLAKDWSTLSPRDGTCAPSRRTWPLAGLRRHGPLERDVLLDAACGGAHRGPHVEDRRDGAQAAQALLAKARSQAIPGLGAVLRPGDAEVP